MKCTACGNENQPGAKFCVHCGVVLMAAPAAAFSPASSSAPMPQSSTATGQRPVTPAPTPAAAMQTGTRPATPPPVAVTSSGAAAAAALSESMVSPGAAPSSRNIGLAIVAVAVLAVIGLGGYFGYRMFAGEGAKQSTAAADSSKAIATPAVPAEPPKDAAATTPSTQEPPTTTVATAPQSSATAESAATPSSTSSASTTPATSTTTPGKAGEVGKAPSGIPKATAPKTAPQPQPVPAIPPTPAQVQAAPPPSKAPSAKAPAVVAQAPVPAGADRWQALADEMARCRKEDLFSRFVCEQRTRAHYCEGYWGKVAQCPSAPSVDHGQ